MIIIQFLLNINFVIRLRRYSSYNINDSQEKIEDIDSNLLLPINDKFGSNIEINNDERKFLNGLVRKYKPKKIVEIGVSAGGTVVLMLNAIKDIPESKLYSIDRSETWYILASRKNWMAGKRKVSRING